MEEKLFCALWTIIQLSHAFLLARLLGPIDHQKVRNPLMGSALAGLLPFLMLSMLIYQTIAYALENRPLIPLVHHADVLLGNCTSAFASFLSLVIALKPVFRWNL